MRFLPGRCGDWEGASNIPEVSESSIVDNAVALRAVVGTDNAVRYSTGP